MSGEVCECGSGLTREPVYGLDGLLYGYNCPQCRAVEVEPPAQPSPENVRPKKFMISTPLGRSFLTTTRHPVYAPHRPEVKPNCGTCGYSLIGNVSGVCPECGTLIPPTLISELLELNRRLKMPVETPWLLFKRPQHAPPTNPPESET